MSRNIVNTLPSNTWSLGRSSQVRIQPCGTVEGLSKAAMTAEGSTAAGGVIGRVAEAVAESGTESAMVAAAAVVAKPSSPRDGEGATWVLGAAASRPGGGVVSPVLSVASAFRLILPSSLELTLTLMLTLCSAAAEEGNTLAPGTAAGDSGALPARTVGGGSSSWVGNVSARARLTSSAESWV